MSEIWLGTIAPAYEPEAFWVAGEDRRQVVTVVNEELEDHWGCEPPFEWTKSTDTYQYCEGVNCSAEVRKIMRLD